MKIFTTIVGLMVLTGALACAAAIDGKWVGEQKMPMKGEEVTVTLTFELKADGNTLTGTVAQTRAGGQGRAIEIKEGKIEGNKFSFITVNQSKQGEMKMKWEGTVEGNELKGTRARDGAPGRGGMPFTAKKQ
jgi:hypothetical protein